MKYQIELVAANEDELSEVLTALYDNVGGRVLESVVLKPVWS